MPIAMGICAETGLSAFMMGVMIEAGAGAGGMSPIATNGIIASGFAEAAGGTNYMGMYIPYVIIMTIEAVAIYFFRGIKMEPIEFIRFTVLPSISIAHLAIGLGGYFGWEYYRTFSSDGL
jgi:hypothetical protein